MRTNGPRRSHWLAGACALALLCTTADAQQRQRQRQNQNRFTADQAAVLHAALADQNTDLASAVQAAENQCDGVITAARPRLVDMHQFSRFLEEDVETQRNERRMIVELHCYNQDNGRHRLLAYCPHCDEVYTIRERSGQDRQGMRQVRQQRRDGFPNRIVRLDEIWDEEVYGVDGEDLGDVENVVVDANTGRILYVALDLDDWDPGQRYLIPWQAFVVRGGDTLVLNMDRDRIERGLSFDDDNWPDLTNPRIARRIHDFFGTEPGFTDGRTRGQAVPNRVIRLDEVWDEEIYNFNGEDLGEVEDIAVDVDTGRILYVAVELDDWDWDDELTLIPWEAFTVRNDDTLALNMNVDRLERGISVDEDEWPDLTNPRVAQRIHRFYGTQPAFDQDQGQARRQQQMPRRQTIRVAARQQVARTLESADFSLTDAIRTAEQQTGGTAVIAQATAANRFQTEECDGRALVRVATLTFQDNQRRLQTAVVCPTSGEVVSTNTTQSIRLSSR